MKITLLAMLAGLAVTGTATAQRAVPMKDTPLFAHDGAGRPRLAGKHIPPLPPFCRADLPQPPTRPAMPDFAADEQWRSALGVTEAQARQVQKLMQDSAAGMQKERRQQRSDQQALCARLRDIVGEQAMTRWAEASAPPPLPPMPPMAPEPPQPPQPPADAR
ncbi:hypothetical protein [Dyella sp.]|jgi:hypothetical protein|uniref:hypothetical protein n=1 Tax=Dyella sp. TaxID=1869338 RepID=UPI002D77EC55|nr:hypothetical protein [Dyella sp.]HET6433187.1 hypothetical protein [Dyella sp.]